MQRRVVRATFACFAMLLGACSTTVAHPPYVSQPQSALVEVASPPPPGRVEVVPERPNRAAVWIDGEWTWRRRRWAWTPGGWVDVPHGAAFSPWVFVRGSDGRLWSAPGVWRDAGGGAVTPPAALVAATVDSDAVVNASGLTENTGMTVKPRASPLAGSGQTPAPAHT